MVGKVSRLTVRKERRGVTGTRWGPWGPKAKGGGGVVEGIRGLTVKGGLIDCLLVDGRLGLRGSHRTGRREGEEDKEGRVRDLWWKRAGSCSRLLSGSVSLSVGARRC